MSSGYHEISTDYLMGPVAELGTMMALDGSNTTMIMQKKAKFDRNCKDAQKAIMDYQERERKRFQESIQTRMGNIERTFSDITNQLSEEKKLQIEISVKAGMSQVPEQPSIDVIKLDADIDVDDFC